MALVREKIGTSTKQEKIKTTYLGSRKLDPVKEFGMTDHMIHRSRHLKKEKEFLLIQM